jgi:MscS family membrane protein
MQRNRLRRLRSHVILLATTLLLAVQMGGALQAAPAGAGRPAMSNQRPGEGRVIPIEEQPFFPELETIAAGWSDVVLDQVVGDSPRATLLNFYAVMAKVGRRADRLGRVTSLARSDAQAQERREQIDDTSLLFQLAVKALDASVFPESVRNDMADEAAIHLKHVLDYVFTHSHQPFVIPDAAGMKTINDERTKPADAWRIPGTAITLTTEVSNDPGNYDYLFSADTVATISEMYQEIRDFPVVDQPFATPELYRDFVYTPGYLVPPAWYLALPRNVRDLIEVPISDQTLFQIACAALAIVLYLLFLAWLGSFMLQTYRERASRAPEGDAWNQDRLAWRRVLIVLPILPLTRFTEMFIDDVVNFTGLPLVVITYALYVIWFLTAGVFMFFVFEAVGRTGSEWLVKLRGGGTPLQLQRVNNLVMPLCRAIGGLVAVVLVYRLLLLLGLPSSTVLAFSAVPGLAIGLGASKLLGNLFAGLSIQTDRPLRVGEFCRVGDNLGFVTRIGLRSLELETLESRVTIPNSVVDEATIINFSRRGLPGDSSPMQGLELRLDLEGEWSPFQLEEVLHQARRTLAAFAGLEDPLVSLERPSESSPVLVVFAMVELHGWPAYLQTREALLLQLEEVVERAQLSEIPIGIAYGTAADQLARVPELMRAAVEQDPQLRYGACRLERIAAFSYDHVLEFSSTHTNHDAFEDSLHDLNRRVISTLEAEGIEIPFPTQTLMLHKS